MKEFQPTYSRRRFVSAVAMTAGAGMILRLGFTTSLSMHC